MSRLTLFSANVNGLNITHQRICFFDILAREHVDIAMICESHLLKKDVSMLNDSQYQLLSSSSSLTKTKGVAIIARRNLEFTNLGSGGDSAGRITFTKTKIENNKIAFLAIYAPNKFDPVFYTQLSDIMHDLTEFKLIIGADFNAVWDYTVDRSSAAEIGDQKSA